MKKHTCSRCHEPKPITQFGPRSNKRKGHYPYCKECRQVISCMQNKKLKRECFEQYGGIKCCCPGCDVTILEFLCLDHKNDDGGKQRKKLKISGGINFYRMLKRKGWPYKDRLQVSCHNCNQGRQIMFGLCPHFSMSSIMKP